MSKTLGEMTPAERDATIRSAAAAFQAELNVTAPLIAEALAEADTRQCLVCLQTGPADMFEPMTASGNVACKARECCAIREAGESPAYYLSALLRSVRQEMGQLTTAELASLAIDLDGYQQDVHIRLSGHADSAAALRAERADRERRKRSKAAKAGAATRAARKSAGS